MNYDRPAKLSLIFKKLSWQGTMVMFEALKEANGSKNGVQIASENGINPDLFSHNIKPLKEFGLIYGERTGEGIKYKVNYKALGRFMDMLKEEMMKGEDNE